MARYFVGPGGSDANTTVQAQNSATPWATIQHASDSAAAGDTVIVLPGSYGVGLSITASSPQGTSGSPITFRSGDTSGNLAKWSATFTHVGANANGIFNIEGGVSGTANKRSWYVFDGFYLNSDGSDQRAGIRLVQSDNTIVQNCQTNNTSVAGVFVTYCTGVQVLNNRLHDANSANGQHGCYMSSGCDHCVFRGNEMYNAVRDGLHMNMATTNPVPYTNQYGLVEKNFSHDNTLAGMDVEGIFFCTYRNNLLVANNKHGITLHSQDQANTDYCMDNLICNNTFVDNWMFCIQFNNTTGSGVNSQGTAVDCGDATRTTVVNNLMIKGIAGQGLTYGCMGFPSQLTQTQTFRSDYNIFFTAASGSSASNGTEVSVNLGTSAISFATWKTNSGNDAHSILANNPLASYFVNWPNVFGTDSTGNYRLKSVTATPVDKGTNTVTTNAVAGLPTDDFDGNARPQGTAYDIGAFEFLQGVVTVPWDWMTHTPTRAAAGAPRTTPDGMDGSTAPVTVPVIAPPAPFVASGFGGMGVQTPFYAGVAVT